ncbi:hypothetical protein SANTM175S_05420 [Streptomyces antimycoticus]
MRSNNLRVISGRPPAQIIDRRYLPVIAEVMHGGGMGDQRESLHAWPEGSPPAWFGHRRPPAGWQAWAHASASVRTRCRRAADRVRSRPGLRRRLVVAVSFTIEDPRITESSGLAASRLHPGVYWTHNDSSDGPYVYAVDGKTGKTVARVVLRGIGDPRDVEAISIGADGNVYVGDIGDNLGGQWSHVWIYRFPEPKQLKDTRRA